MKVIIFLFIQVFKFELQKNNRFICSTIIFFRLSFCYCIINKSFYLVFEGGDQIEKRETSVLAGIAMFDCVQ